MIHGVDEKVPGDCLTGPSLNQSDFCGTLEYSARTEICESVCISEFRPQLKEGNVRNTNFHIVSPTSDCIVVLSIGSGRFTVAGNTWIQGG